MENFKQMLLSIDINNLLKIFDIQIAIAVLLVFVVFRNAFSKLIIKIYYKIIKSKKIPKESAMYKPLKIFFVFLGVVCMVNILPTSKQFLYIMNKLFEVVIIYYITKAITTLITIDSPLLKKFFKTSSNKAVDKLVCTLIRLFIWMVSICIALNELGFKLKDFSILVTGLGIGSAAIALAAQDLVKSLLSGFSILTDKPFVIGDWIEVGQYQGTVIDITFRSTRIKANNNAVVTIPNSTITSEYVVNWNRLTSRRFDCVLGLSLETPSEKIKKIVKQMKVVLENDPLVIKGTVQVNFDAISASSSDIKIFLYVNVADYNAFLKAKQDILCSLLFLIEKENIELAYPTQTLYVKRKEETLI